MNTHIKLLERVHEEGIYIFVGIYSIKNNNALKVLHSLPLVEGHYHFDFLDEHDDELNEFKIKTLCSLLEIILPHIKGIPNEPDEEDDNYCDEEHEEWRNNYQIGIENVIECDYISFYKMLDALKNHLARNHDACLLVEDLDLEKVRNLWINLV